MNTRSQMRIPRSNHRTRMLIVAGFLLMVCAGCSPASTQAPEPPTAGPTTLPAASPTTPPASPAPTAAREAEAPAGWATYSSQSCDYAISYPADMQVASNGSYSRILDFKTDNPDEAARNFVYVSVVDPEVRGMVEAGIYNGEVYNYDPVEAEILLNMPVGESSTVRQIPNVEAGFIYERGPDAQISGYAAQIYENDQPWEFPAGTKEIRYFLSRDECTYVIGGYLDTTGGNQPGAISEELFNQMMATILVIP
jgi:hypothetical protein